MKEYLDTKTVYNQISFHLTDNPFIGEREIHSYHEILLYIDGDAELLTKNGQLSLNKPSIIVIPKETYHFFRLKKPEKFIRLKISFSDFLAEEQPFRDLLSEMKIFDNLNEATSYSFTRICDILKTANDNNGFFTYSAFMMLVSELLISSTEDSAVFYTENNRLMTEVIGYISENLSENLNIHGLAERFLISPSSITHLFKNEFGISIHKYIMQQRLIKARKLILHGEKPTKMYMDVGFTDYSSFYKAYVRFWNYPPSEEIKQEL